MAILGHISTISIPEVFAFLHQMRKTGTLCVVSEQQERSFVFQNGDIVFATAGDRSRRLGDYLVRLGILNAYLLPDGGAEALYASISPVNSFRVILNAYFGHSLPLLPDKSYRTDSSKSNKFAPVDGDEAPQRP